MHKYTHTYTGETYTHHTLIITHTHTPGNKTLTFLSSQYEFRLRVSNLREVTNQFSHCCHQSICKVKTRRSKPTKPKVHSLLSHISSHALLRAKLCSTKHIYLQPWLLPYSELLHKIHILKIHTNRYPSNIRKGPHKPCKVFWKELNIFGENTMWKIPPKVCDYSHWNCLIGYSVSH